MNTLNPNLIEAISFESYDFANDLNFTDSTALFDQYEPFAAEQNPAAANDDCYENLYPSIV